MDTISINEAILATLAEDESFDSSNAIEMFRASQATIRSLFPDVDLDLQLPWEEADEYIVSATANGAQSLFA